MRLPNGYGGVVKLSGNRRRPYAARITTGWYHNDKTGKRVQKYQVIEYAATRAEALQILAKYNDYPIDAAALKLTFHDIYLRWSEEKFSTTSASNIKGYRAAYSICENIADVPFRNLRLDDLQRVVDRCGKNYPNSLCCLASLSCDCYVTSLNACNNTLLINLCDCFIA